MKIHFSILDVSVSDEIFQSKDVLSIRRMLHLVLRASKDTEIVLSTGEKLCSVDVNLSLENSLIPQYIRDQLGPN